VLWWRTIKTPQFWVDKIEEDKGLIGAFTFEESFSSSYPCKIIVQSSVVFYFGPIFMDHVLGLVKYGVNKKRESS